MMNLMRSEATVVADHVTRIVLTNEPFQEYQFANGLWRRYHWPAWWVAPQGSLEPPLVFAARCRFQTETGHAPIRIHVSADERFELYLDGQLVARGPERGDFNNYFFQSYDLRDLPRGDHLLTARVWAMGDAAPIAQLSAGPAFLLAAEGPWGDLLSTGIAAWETRRIEGIEIRHHPHIGPDGFTGKKIKLNARRYPFGFENDQAPGSNWAPARKRYAATTGVPTDRHALRTLRAGMLPDMLRKPIPAMKVRFAEQLADEVDLSNHRCLTPNQSEPLSTATQNWLEGKSALQIGPHTRLRAILDLDEYYCAYPYLVASGGDGAEVQLGWAESLYTNPGLGEKGDRNEIDGKFFRGYADEFVLDGGEHRHLNTLWWQAGRYLQLHIKTGNRPVTLHSLSLEETRYPLGEPRLPETNDPRLASAIQLGRRALECSLHETFMDCPYYEQLSYVGDTRLEALVVMTCYDDDRPVRKAIELFDSSRLPSGFTQSRYPCRVMQVIPTFSMIWVGMVHDFLRLRKDVPFVRGRMPGVRAVMDACLAHVNPETNLLANPPGWNFMDWAPTFVDGMPVGDGPSGSINWLFAMALRWWAELEEQVGEPELAARARRWLGNVVPAIDGAFWDEFRGAWSEDLEHQKFSEHAQALAIKGSSDTMNPELSARCGRAVQSLSDPQPDFAPATIYFTHYVIEALRRCGDHAAIERRLDLWRSLTHTGLRCLPEQPEPTRSDCHGWGAHILYHLMQDR
jgi:hypothetical protein